MRAQDKDLGLSHELSSRFWRLKDDQDHEKRFENILPFILDEPNEPFLDILAKIHKNGMRRTLRERLRDQSCIEP